MDIFSTLIDAIGHTAFTIAFAIIALSIIVAIHEYGHYIVGRWCGIHAEVFSLGMGKPLWQRTDKRGTVWQVAALPFGGYVRFLGDANAASVGTTGDVATARNTMAGAPLWARALTVLAGPVFNFVSAILIYIALILNTGQAIDPLTVGSFREDVPAFSNDLLVGDVIVQIEDQEINELSDVGDSLQRLPFDAQIQYVVERGGDRLTVNGPHPFPASIGSIQPRSAAYSAGLEVGDTILSINGEDVFSFAHVQQITEGSGGNELNLTIHRAGDILPISLQPRQRDVRTETGDYVTKWQIGFTGGHLFFEPALESVGVLDAISGGVQRLWFVLTGTFDVVGRIISGSLSSCNLSGPVGMAQAAGTMASQGITTYVSLIAAVSIGIGLFNLFPIPVLDGGHLVFFAYEAITGRKPSEKALQILMVAGLTILLSIMVFALGNDLFCR